MGWARAGRCLVLPLLGPLPVPCGHSDLSVNSPPWGPVGSQHPIKTALPATTPQWVRLGTGSGSSLTPKVRLGGPGSFLGEVCSLQKAMIFACTYSYLWGAMGKKEGNTHSKYNIQKKTKAFFPISVPHFPSL